MKFNFKVFVHICVNTVMHFYIILLSFCRILKVTILSLPFPSVTACSPSFFLLSLFIYLFIYFERERGRERAWVEEGQRERERENPKQAPHCQRRAWCGAPTHEAVRSWLEPKPRVGCLSDWATQASLPVHLLPYQYYLFVHWFNFDFYILWLNLPIQYRYFQLKARNKFINVKGS